MGKFVTSYMAQARTEDEHQAFYGKLLEQQCKWKPQQHRVIREEGKWTRADGGCIPPPALPTAVAFATGSFGLGTVGNTTTGGEGGSRDLQAKDPQRHSNCKALALYRNVNTDFSQYPPCKSSAHKND